MSTMGYVSTMEGAAASASLSLDFEKQSYRVMEGGKQVSKGFDELFTFSRATTGGRFNEKGLYETVPANQPRFDYDPITKVLKGLLVEEQRTNLVTMSEQLGSWINYQSASKRSEVVSPSGILNATKVIPSSKNIWHQIHGNVFAVTAGNNYTASVFAKKGETDVIKVTFESITLFPYGNTGVFNLSTGTVVSGPGAKIQAVGDGWYRCSVTPLCAVTGTIYTSFSVGSSPYAGDGVSGLHFWGAQVEMGSFATSYIPTEATFTSRASTATYYDSKGVLRTAGVNVARTGAYLYDQSGVLQPVGLLLESAATNLFDNSEDFELNSGGSTWGKNYVTVSPSEVVSPTGEGFYRNVVISYLAGTPALVSKPLTSIVPASVLTLSFYVKAGTASKCSLRFYDSIGEAGRATFDLVAGTVQAQQGTVNLGGTITRLKDNAYRISLTCDYTTRDRAGLYAYLIPDFAAQVVGKSILAWGAQLETGRDVTSYIPSKATFTSRASTATYIDKDGVLRTAAVNVARLDAYTTNGLRIGQLLEDSRTNLLTFSEELTNTSWTAPTSGRLEASTLVSGLVTAPGRVYWTSASGKDCWAGKTLSFEVGRYSLSVFIAKTSVPSQGYVQFNEATLSNRAEVIFDLATGVITSDTAIGTTIRDAGLYWHVTTGVDSTTVRASGQIRIGLKNIASPTTGTYFDWGCPQLEFGAFSTSYIPTAAAAVTRASDIYSRVTTTRAADASSSVETTRTYDKTVIDNISSWYNLAEGTVVADFTPGVIYGGNYQAAVRFRVSDSESADVMSISRASETSCVASVTNSAGVQQFGTPYNLPLPNGTRLKASLGVKVNSGAFSPKGSTVQTADTLVMPTPTMVAFGQTGANTQCINGYLHSIHYYPLRLSSPQLQIISE